MTESAHLPSFPSYDAQTSMFRWWIPRGKWNTFLSRQLRIPLMAFWGISGTAMPYRTPVTLVIGKPIHVGPPQSNPPIEQVRQSSESTRFQHMHCLDCPFPIVTAFFVSTSILTQHIVVIIPFDQCSCVADSGNSVSIHFSNGRFVHEAPRSCWACTD